MNWEHSNQNVARGSGVYCYKATYMVRRQWVFILCSGYNIKIFLNDWLVVTSYQSWETVCFIYGYQRHEQEMDKVISQNKLNKLCSYVWLNWFLSAQGVFKASLHLFFILTLEKLFAFLEKVGIYTIRLSGINCSK